MFRKKLLGFDTANQFIQKVDKKSIQLILRKNGAIIGKNCDIESGLTFHNNKNYSNLIIGNNCHIGKNCFFDLRDKVIIKNNCVISMQVTFITHMEMNKSELSNLYPSSRGSILIENDVYIGTNAIILMNRTIGENSFIAAGSLINRDVDRGKMVGGVPAKVIKQLKKE
jgi:acetyltransferase-like isoleucine patch superfamily enzyme